MLTVVENFDSDGILINAIKRPVVILVDSMLGSSIIEKECIFADVVSQNFDIVARHKGHLIHKFLTLSERPNSDTFSSVSDSENDDLPSQILEPKRRFNGSLSQMLEQVQRLMVGFDVDSSSTLEIAVIAYQEVKKAYFPNQRHPTQVFRHTYKYNYVPPGFYASKAAMDAHLVSQNQEALRKHGFEDFAELFVPSQACRTNEDVIISSLNIEDNSKILNYKKKYIEPLIERAISPNRVVELTS